jgi:hypothetical protein
LKLVEHTRDRMGLYAESASMARELLAACDRGHPNYAPVVAAMARLALGESLLLDLRIAEARRVLLAARHGASAAPWIAARAQLLLGRALDLEGDREGAQTHYLLAQATSDRDSRQRAAAGLGPRVTEAQARATPLLAEARRLREAGHAAAAAGAYREALRLWPGCDEAALRVAEDDLRHGRAATAREVLAVLADRDRPQPPWVRPWARLLLANAHDVAGDRGAAVQLYKFVLINSLGQDGVREAAERGLAQPFAVENARDAAPDSRNHPK